MARIQGIDLPRDKRLEIALTYIYGIGRKTASEIVGKANLDPSLRVKDMSSDDIAQIRAVLGSGYKVEGALRTETQMNVKRLMDIGCYRGIRHRRSLPVRGQRTHTNARTRKGRRRGIGMKR